MRPSRRSIRLFVASLLLPWLARADVPLFSVESYPQVGRTIAANLADFDGDGRTDLMVVITAGIPPRETRTARVYLQQTDGVIPTQPSHSVAIPPWSAVYDIADLRDEAPGAELVLLRPDGVTLLSLADASGRSWHLVAPGPSTVAASEDERGLEPYDLVFRDFGPDPWILVPQIGRTTALSPEGEVLAWLEVGRRANFYVVPQDSFYNGESNIHLFFPAAKLGIGDIDGDGRADIVASSRHELRVFLQREDGGFDSSPSRSIPLGLVTQRDHIRGSGGVVSLTGDIDGDGRLDLVLSHTQGNFTSAKTDSYVYINRDGQWDLASPDAKFSREASVGFNLLADLDANGRLELLEVETRFSLLEAIEFLLSKEIDVRVTARSWEPGVGFGERPIVDDRLSIPIDFETFRPKGFIPRLGVDLTGDGFMDLMTSGEGKALELHLGDGSNPFVKRVARQKMRTLGVIHYADVNADGLPDFVLFDPHNFDIPVQIGRNLGTFADQPATIRSRPAPP